MWRRVASTAPLLHRWCHRASPRYAQTCDVERKVEAAMHDHCYRPPERAPPRPTVATRDPVTVLWADAYGM
jgi:hypothetical protein